MYVFITYVVLSIDYRFIVYYNDLKVQVLENIIKRRGNANEA
jgi:hypothetical protein